MAWDPAGEGNDPGILAQRAEIEYGAQAVLYPAPGGDHSALALLLSLLTEDRFAPIPDLPTRATLSAIAPRLEAVVAGRGGPPKVAAGGGPGRAFHRAGRGTSQARPVGRRPTGRPGGGDRVGRGGQDRPGHPLGAAGRVVAATWRVRGFGWSFYADPSAEHWAAGLLRWAWHKLGIRGAPSVGRRLQCWGCCGRYRCCWFLTGWKCCRKARPRGVRAAAGRATARGADRRLPD